MWAHGVSPRPLALALLATALVPLVAGQPALPTAAQSTLAQIQAGAAQLQRQALWLAAATSTVLPLGAIEAGTAKAAGTALYRGYQVAEAFGAGPAVAQTAGTRKAVANAFMSATAPAARAAAQAITQLAAATAVETPAAAPLDISEPVEIPDFAGKSLGYVSPSEKQPAAALPMMQIPMAIGSAIVDPTGRAPTGSAESAEGETATAPVVTPVIQGTTFPSAARTGQMEGVVTPLTQGNMVLPAARIGQVAGLVTPMTQGNVVPPVTRTQAEAQVGGVTNADPLTQITKPSGVLPMPSSFVGTPSVTAAPKGAPAALSTADFSDALMTSMGSQETALLAAIEASSPDSSDSANAAAGPVVSVLFPTETGPSADNSEPSMISKAFPAVNVSAVDPATVAALQAVANAPAVVGVSDTPQPSPAQRAATELAKAVETLALARNRLAALEASGKVPKVLPGVAGPLAAPAPAPAKNAVREADPATDAAPTILAATLGVPQPNRATAEAFLTGDAFPARDPSAFAPGLAGALHTSASAAEVLPDVDARPVGALGTSGSAGEVLPGVAGPLATPAAAPAKSAVREADSATGAAPTILASTLGVPHPNRATAEAFLTGDAFPARDPSAFAPSLAGALQTSAYAAEVLPDVDARQAGTIHTSVSAGEVLPAVAPSEAGRPRAYSSAAEVLQAVPAPSAAEVLPAVAPSEAGGPHAYSSAADVLQAVPNPSNPTDQLIYIGAARKEAPTAAPGATPVFSQPAVAPSRVSDSAAFPTRGTLAPSRVSDSATFPIRSSLSIAEAPSRVSDSAAFPIRSALPIADAPNRGSDSAATFPTRSALPIADAPSRGTDSAAAFPTRSGVPIADAPNHGTDSATFPTRISVPTMDPALPAQALTVSALPAPSMRDGGPRGAVTVIPTGTLPSIPTSQASGLPVGVYDAAPRATVTPAPTKALPTVSPSQATGLPVGVYDAAPRATVTPAPTKALPSTSTSQATGLPAGVYTPNAADVYGGPTKAAPATLTPAPTGRAPSTATSQATALPVRVYAPDVAHASPTEGPASTSAAQVTALPAGVYAPQLPRASVAAAPAGVRPFLSTPQMSGLPIGVYATKSPERSATPAGWGGASAEGATSSGGGGRDAMERAQTFGGGGRGERAGMEGATSSGGGGRDATEGVQTFGGGGGDSTEGARAFAGARLAPAPSGSTPADGALVPVATPQDLYNKTDKELLKVFEQGVADIPSSLPGSTGGFAFCNDTATFTNSPGPMPHGLPFNGAPRMPDEIANALIRQIWRAKAFVTDPKTNETRMWNVLFADGNTELLAQAKVKVNTLEDGKPGITIDYAGPAEEGLFYHLGTDEFRRVGDNVWLGRGFLGVTVSNDTTPKNAAPLVQPLIDAASGVVNATGEATRAVANFGRAAQNANPVTRQDYPGVQYAPFYLWFAIGCQNVQIPKLHYTPLVSDITKWLTSAGGLQPAPLPHEFGAAAPVGVGVPATTSVGAASGAEPFVLWPANSSPAGSPSFMRLAAEPLAAMFGQSWADPATHAVEG